MRLGDYMNRVISREGKSILVSLKLFCPDEGRLEIRFFVYSILKLEDVKIERRGYYGFYTKQQDKSDVYQKALCNHCQEDKQ